MLNTIQYKRNRVSGTVFAASRQVWLAGLGAAVVTRDWAEQEAGQVFRTLVSEGTAVESRAFRIVGDRVESSITRANVLWKQTRADRETTVRAYADTAVTIVRKSLPKALPRVELPAHAAGRAAAKATRPSARSRRAPRRPRSARSAPSRWRSADTLNSAMIKPLDRVVPVQGFFGRHAQMRCRATPRARMHGGAHDGGSGSRKARTAQGARARDARAARSAARIGLALAGGGPLGGIYEVGALLALADSLDGFDLNDLDVYVGVSSGSFVAAALANGISPAQMYRLFIEDGADAALKPRDLPAPRARRVRAPRGRAAARSLLRASLQYLRDPFQRGAMESFATLARAMPTGVFDNAPSTVFLSRLFAAPGRTNDFRKLRASCSSSRRTSTPARR